MKPPWRRTRCGGQQAQSEVLRLVTAAAACRLHHRLNTSRMRFLRSCVCRYFTGGDVDVGGLSGCNSAFPRKIRSMYRICPIV